MDEEIKIGAMISRVNKETLTAAHDAISKLGIGCGEGKSIDPEELVNYGGEIKALGNGRVGGYLVRFSTSDDPDLTGDYFTKETNLNIPDSLPVFYNHGLDTKMGKRPIGTATSKVDEVGAWVETQLNMRDDYEKAIYAMAEAGKLGYSSGALSHLVEREPVKAGVAFIKTWYVGEASLTPTPAEPRNSIVTLKSLLPVSGGVADETDTKTLSTNLDKEFEMDELELQAKIDAAFAKRDAEVKAAEVKAAELKTAEDAGYKKAIEELKARGLNAPAFNTQPLGFSPEKDAVPGFMAWVKTGQENGALIRPDSNMMAIKGAGDAFNITTSGSGGALVPDPLLDRIIAKRNAASWIRLAPCQYFTTDSDHLLIPREVTSMSDFVVTNESAAYDENEGTVGQIDLALLKYTKMTQVTQEFLAGNNSNFESWFMDRLGAAAANTENTVATTAWLAGATAATAAASQTALTIAEMERLVGSLGEGYAVQGQTGFIMKRSTHYYLRGVQLASYQAWDFAGEPVFEAAGMGAMTNGLYSTGYGNFNYFAVLERPGMLIQRNPWLHMNTGEIDFFANIYRAVAVLQGEAFYKMAQA